MFSYTISNKADNNYFKKICQIIENELEVTKHRLLIDVDGSLIQKYCYKNKSIKVYNDYEIYAVYIESEIDLSVLLNSENIDYN